MITTVWEHSFHSPLIISLGSKLSDIQIIEHRINTSRLTLNT